MTTGAGHLYYEIAFDKRSDFIDEYGNVVNGWVQQFTTKARAMFLRGGETVMQARLAGTQPVVLTVHASTDTRQIRTDWQARFVNEASLPPVNIRSVTPNEDRKWIDVLCQIGVAT